MNNAAINTATETLTIDTDGMAISYSPRTDDRLTGFDCGEVICRSKHAAKGLVSELAAWGVKAQAFANRVALA